MLVFSVLDALTQQMGTAAVTKFTFAQAVQKWLHYAPFGGAQPQEATGVYEVYKGGGVEYRRCDFLHSAAFWGDLFLNLFWWG